MGAALNWSVAAGRVPYAPKVKGVKAEERSPPRDRILSIAEVGSMLGFATDDKLLRRFIVAQLATACRPEVVLKWDVKRQADFDRSLFDVHPLGAPRTKKRNPVVPIPRFWRPMLKEWLADGERFPASIRTRWWTMKAALGLGSEVHAKTLRYTVATFMRAAGVPWADIEGQLGHSMRSQSGVYAKYAPGYLASATAAIEAHWEQALSAEQKWLADHLRTKVGNGRTEIVPRMTAKSLEM
jgi:integrase